MIFAFIDEIPRNMIKMFIKRVNHDSRKVTSETIREKISFNNLGEDRGIKTLFFF